MTPFQKLLADKEALALYVERCRKLPFDERPDLAIGQIFHHPKFGLRVLMHLATEDMDAQWGVYPSGGGWRDATDFFVGDEVYLPSDLAEWMVMKGWHPHWLLWPETKGGLWVVHEMATKDVTIKGMTVQGWDGLREDISWSEHPHIAVAEAVLGESDDNI